MPRAPPCPRPALRFPHRDGTPPPWTRSRHPLPPPARRRSRSGGSRVPSLSQDEPQPLIVGGREEQTVPPRPPRCMRESGIYQPLRFTNTYRYHPSRLQTQHTPCTTQAPSRYINYFHKQGLLILLHRTLFSGIYQLPQWYTPHLKKRCSYHPAHKTIL